ncbi:hypothetical protein BN946_scf185008.g32 [Trametes cinnabarina]|uniref:Peptidase M20 dimerisation domain-containing protein n=1 Tax=Pycnoporus cinnabarinus TaxID=5643 RepID=A0A060SFX4_PYCCI|nr:hypothetical protein BN946_scf185008.g32 [Trametes cinnabarina]
MLAALLTEIEDNPHPTLLRRHSSTYNATQCLATYAPSFPAELRRLAREAERSDDALALLTDALLEEYGAAYEVLLRTTQAVDLIEGGVKVNALPERAAAIVNHRIVQESSVEALESRLAELLRPLASRFNLTMDAFGRTVLPASVSPSTATNMTSKGHLSINVAFGYALGPSPVTPSGSKDPYQVLAGTIRSAIADSPRMAGTNIRGVIVVPQIEHGNTGGYRGQVNEEGYGQSE